MHIKLCEFDSYFFSVARDFPAMVMTKVDGKHGLK